MNHLTKGALTMVLAGSVTFSVANAWLGGQPAKQLLEKVNAIAHSELQKKANFLDNQADQKVKGQASKTGIKDGQTMPSHHTVAVHAVIKKGNNSDHSINNVKSTTETSTARVTVPPSKKATSSSASSSQPRVHTSSASTKISTTVTTAPKKTTAGTTTSPVHSHPAPNVHAASASTKGSKQKTTSGASTTSTTTNHGQQVSEIQREKNATNAADKTNNGKKM